MNNENPKCPFCGSTMWEHAHINGVIVFACLKNCILNNCYTIDQIADITAALAQHDAQKAEPVKDERFEKLLQAVHALHADVFMGFLKARSESKAEKAYLDISKKLDNFLYEATE